ncbi:hypothetical protein FSARC_8226 [Fusarium sarcochroum]|uniref:Glycosyltransferase family 28 N-terminal domain-containing protein n=1 Tax=Fusarium sarcochroum TaxID=1208366 RepID=A0A8H4X6H5_9HYPO|nr:hypothetical protein FSARC_8226 [Fusarium sarcochroum]
MERQAPPHSIENAEMSMPRLNIVIMGFGSRGDLEPTLEIAKVLQFQHKHRVRYVTHAKYQHIVEAAGIEFYSLGRTDPREMIARRGRGSKEIRRVLPEIQDEFFEMGQRSWGACVDDPVGIPPGTSPDPFVADAIIGTMTTYVHSSAAARLGVPLHLQANNPRVYSKYIPHSQAEGSASSTSVTRNVLSWWIKDYVFNLMLESGFNRIRVQNMGLETFSPLWWTSQFFRVPFPCTNLWSSHLLPKPADWGEEIDIAGFAFTEEKPYTPPDALVKFLEAGDEPVYVGFGSMAFPTSDQVIEAVFDGIKATGRRTVYAKGWSGTDADTIRREDVFVVDEIPHHWIFPKVAAVVIHMGAGTFSTALKHGKPIVMIPIAGDQPFWSHRVWKAGCGPEPIPLDGVTSDLVATRLQEALSPEISLKVKDMADQLSKEEPGQVVFARSALKTFEKIYANTGCCDLLPGRLAVWQHKLTKAKLSAVAASILVNDGRIPQKDLSLIRHVEIPDLKCPGDPVSGLVNGIVTIGSRILSAFGSFTNLKTAPSVFQGSLQVVKSFTHVIASPVIFLQHVSYGLYNLLEYTTFKLGSVSQPQQFDSNTWTYSYWKMLYLLTAVPFKELSPSRNTFSTLLLSPFRSAIAIINIPIGIVAFALRIVNRYIDQSLGFRPAGDVVFEARVRQGKREKQLATNDLYQQVIQGWEK